MTGLCGQGLGVGVRSRQSPLLISRGDMLRFQLFASVPLCQVDRS